ncbi:DUF3000 domain-containing protein [Oerskovia sp. Sa1BUA8]|uniref:DUF3000 domain-containing protein n=1 Tax=Oerskovia douganii TaxID=2762210 RepID=A0A9D5UHH3_9CELL|nr:DUF3000 domain-containing protein [Oerskovia douganii]
MRTSARTVRPVIKSGEPQPPPDFLRALESIGTRRVRPEVSLREVTAPSRIAPYALALTGEVAEGTASGEAHANGRFIVLHDPAGQESWHGTFRVVTLVRATLDPELATDPLLGEVAWSWLQEALEHAGVDALAEGGTVTRVMSESFGALAGQANGVDLEIRASWTPTSTDLGPHLDAWSTLLCTAAGLPPLPDGVTPLRSRRNTVGP